jgi:hypothetical protein
VNDVKEICELALDAPAPPLRDPAEALAIARRSARRRDRLTVAAAALAVVAAASATTMIAPGLVVAGADRAPTAQVTGAQQMTVAPPAAPDVPIREAAHAHGRQIAQTLIDAVPSGYSAYPEYSSPDGDPTATWMREPPSESYVSMTSIVMSAGDREGLLQASIVRDGVAAPGGDLCSTDLADRIDPIFGAGTDCQVVVVDGVPIRVTSRNDPDVGATLIAVRFLQGGILGVVSTQGRWTFDSSSELPPDAVRSPDEAPVVAPELTSLVFTAAELAAIAGNPAMLP